MYFWLLFNTICAFVLIWTEHCYKSLFLSHLSSIWILRLFLCVNEVSLWSFATKSEKINQCETEMIGVSPSLLYSRTCCALCPPPGPQSTLKTCWRSRSSQKTLGWRAERQISTPTMLHLSPSPTEGSNCSQQLISPLTAVPSCRPSSAHWAFGSLPLMGLKETNGLTEQRTRNLLFLTSVHPVQFLWIPGGRWPNATIENLGVSW